MTLYLVTCGNVLPFFEAIPKSEPFSLGHFVPEPEGLTLREKVTWRRKNWGCVEDVFAAKLLEKTPTFALWKLMFHIDSFPIPHVWLKEVSRKFPGIRFSLQYEMTDKKGRRHVEFVNAENGTVTMSPALAREVGISEKESA